MFFNCFLFAQTEERKTCGTSKIMEEALKNSEKKQILDQLEIFTAEFINNLNNSRLLDTTYIIPVVVHVIHNYGNENISYEQIDNGMDRINEDFQGINDDLSEVIPAFDSIKGFPNFEFRLATKDPEGNCTYGVTRTASPWTENSGSKVMPLANWDDKKYVNIYVVRSFDENMSFAAAYATKPGSGSDEYGDYIFCKYDYFGDWNTNSDTGPTNGNWARHTMPHEMGHFFNLDHPWGGSNSPGEDGNCSIDDGVEDTPPTIGTDGNEVGCPLEQATCDGSLDNVQNIMDYSACAHMFTQGQADRMLAAANSLAGNRWYLWQQENLIATGTDDATFNNGPYVDCAPIPDFRVENELGCSGSEMLFENFTYNYRDSEITYSWVFEGADPSTSNSINPIITYNDPGSYDVTLTACRDGNCNTVTRENAITILSQTNVDAEEGLSQGFESLTFPYIEETGEIWWGGNDQGEQHWERTELAASEGLSSLKIKSQNYGYDRAPHAFSTPELNLSDFTTSSSDPLMLCFDIAYAKRLPYNAVSFDENGLVEGDPYSIHNDNLIISFKGCGDSPWSERPWISTRPGQDGAFTSQQQSLFSTDLVYFNSFIPNDDQWKQICVNIQALAGDDEAVIKFEFQGVGEDQYDFHWVDDGFSNQGELINASTIGGNWLYLDNIRIGNSSVIQEESSARNEFIEDLVVSPNPSSEDEAWLAFETMEYSEITISISNFLGVNIGRKVIDLPAGRHNMQLSDLFHLQQGSFILNIEDGSTRLSDVIIIR
jgi:PKD repeat protein